MCALLCLLKIGHVLFKIHSFPCSTILDFIGIPSFYLFIYFMIEGWQVESL